MKREDLVVSKCSRLCIAKLGDCEMGMLSFNEVVIDGKGKATLVVFGGWEKMGGYGELGRKGLRPFFTTARQVMEETSRQRTPIMIDSIHNPR